MIGHSKVSSIAFTHTNTHTHSVCEFCSQELIGVRLVGAKGVIKKEKHRRVRVYTYAEVYPHSKHATYHLAQVFHKDITSHATIACYTRRQVLHPLKWKDV